MKRFLIISLLLVSSMTLRAQDTVTVYKMGEVYGVDSSKVSPRKFPMKLVMPKGGMGVGIQGLWVKMDASDAQALALVSDLTGSVKVGRVSAAFMWAYSNNNALGIRLGYSHLNLFSETGSVRILTDDLKFDISKIATTMNTYSVSFVNRSWFGLDDRGRISLIADVALGYAFSNSSNGSKSAETHKVGLGIAPGLEIFVMNNLSFFFTLNFANLSYSSSQTNADGTSSTFNAQMRLNIFDLNFGLALYF